MDIKISIILRVCPTLLSYKIFLKLISIGDSPFFLNKRK